MVLIALRLSSLSIPTAKLVTVLTPEVSALNPLANHQWNGHVLGKIFNRCLTRSATSGVEFGTASSASNLRLKAGDDHPRSVIVKREKKGVDVVRVVRAKDNMYKHHQTSY